jgi:hypothetical protein
MRLSMLRPLNRAVKYQASVQSSDATALRLATSSKLRRTTFELFDSAEDRNSG